METLLTKNHYDHLLLLKITYCKPHESASGSSWFCHNDECGEKGHKNPDQQNAAKLSATGFDHWGVPMKAKDDYGCNRDEHSYTCHTENLKDCETTPIIYDRSFVKIVALTTHLIDAIDHGLE